MAIAFDSLAALLDHGFDTLIDVRSPAEYAEDHIPGAINLPALTNAQRAEVGTIYKQVSPFLARKVGAAMVARNVADHLDGPLKDKDGGWRPLVYCWRGGQRSGSFSSILAQIGWRTDTIKGGYQSFRRLVHGALYDAELPFRVVLLDGFTGTAKTDVLGLMAGEGVQVLDLEGLARHRGSLLGGIAGGQPGQKAFETALAVALMQLDPSRPVLVEAESSKIGRLIVPPVLWKAMVAAPRIVIDAPLEARAAYLTRAYADVIADREELARRLAPLRHIRGHATVDGWLKLLDAGHFNGLAAALMAEHYDPAYANSRRIEERTVLGTATAQSLDEQGQRSLASQIAKLMPAQ
ncbi:MAG: tRNA 2-selenouridine(34) synthase MnmH [Limimaricola sp.]|uniref:tRNA 2-selenouridine(34) synthase MnmH n=1 Tax=Limimaricola sp. TaxID=2211665 RepID=UPI001DE6D0E8|nr:tRNA 2-selenouridine(34) synthase MnmH [Limimaricola sp.]MBI1418846.1 tRNA 2-selenouridine(34) synthase MnmH [Limimaricola sp.]